MWWGETGSLQTAAAGSAWQWGHRDTPSTQGFTATGFNRSSLKVFFLSLSLLLRLAERGYQIAGVQSSDTAALYLFLHVEISSNHLSRVKKTLDILFRLNHHSVCDAHCWPFLCKQDTLCRTIWAWGHSLKISTGNLDTMTKAQDFDHQILTRTKSPAQSGNGVR